ncbi:MAG: hypothetical protein ACE5HV_05395 [Acidobacteriota bacterium]
MDILPVIEACIRNLESAGYRSFDLFDGLSSPFARPLRSGPRIVARIWQQIFLRLPVNLRRALGVRKTVSSKTLADVLKASALLRLSGVEVQTGLESLSEKILARAHRGWSGKCWGTDLPYASRVVQDGGGTPNLVTTCFCADALLSAYLVTRDARLLEAAKSACAFIADDLGELRLAEGVCFRYFPGVDEAIHNANMLGAALCARVGKLTAVQNLIDRALAATDYTVACQRADGSWYYGEKAQYHWIDNFHTGYVLDSLLTILRVAPKDDHRAARREGSAILLTGFSAMACLPNSRPTADIPLTSRGSHKPSRPCASSLIGTDAAVHLPRERSLGLWKT